VTPASDISSSSSSGRHEPECVQQLLTSIAGETQRRRRSAAAGRSPRVSRTARGPGGRAARLYSPPGRGGARGEHLDDRPPRRSLDQHGEAAVGTAAHPSRRARALPTQPPRASASSPSSTSCRSPADASSEHRRADPSRVRARSRSLRDRPRAHGRGRADGARRATVVGVDGTRCSRPFESVRERLRRADGVRCRA